MLKIWQSCKKNIVSSLDDMKKKRLQYMHAVYELSGGNELYVPTDGELTEIKDESIEFVNYLNSLIT